MPEDIKKIMPEDIKKIKLELEEARETIRIRDQRITGLQENLDTLQRERPKLTRELEEAKETIGIKDQRITGLNKVITGLNERITGLQGNLDTLQRERPKLTPEHLIASFKTALAKMQEGLKISEGRVDYVISKLDTDLKVNITLDEDDNINFQLPKLEDIIPFENLSTLHFSIKSAPKLPAPPPETAEVPNLIGMPKDAAVGSIRKAKFDVDEDDIEYRTSVTAPGTVIEQSPAPYSRRARIKGKRPIHLVISKVREVKVREVEVPNVIGMDRDNAIEVIRSGKLTVGKITEEVSDSPPGTVISQSITADTLMPVETSIDLVIAKPEMVSMPDVIGKRIRYARTIIRKARLKVGKITEEPSGEPPNTVIEQKPGAEEKVPINTEVDITVSKPEMEYIKAEDVPEEQAKRILDFLNSAKTAEEVADAVKFPGERDVGVKTAQHILAARDKLGRFTDLKQVDSVRQVGPERFTETVKALG